MMERRQIVALWRQSQSWVRSGVLMTLVRAEGSSYRRPGARLMVCNERGKPHAAGTISGGCLEGELVRRAEWKVRAGAAIERYSMVFDDTEEMPFGLGCGGTVDVLFEHVETPEARALLEAMAASLEGHTATAVSFLPGDGRGLRRLILDARGEVLFASEGLTERKIDCARELLPGHAYEGRFVERLEAPQRLFLLGAGDDAKPVAAMAAQLGWTVVVADGRPQLARAERFPWASRVQAIDDANQLGLCAGDAVVLMTHSYEQDRALLAGLFSAVDEASRDYLDLRYLGLLGSRHRSSLLVAEAAAMVGRDLEACCRNIFAPVGLDLGGDGPEAIALAIVSEVQACCFGRMGSSRRFTPAEVESQLALGGSSRYLQTRCALGVAGD